MEIPNIQGLGPNRKADRAKIAAGFVAVAEQLGAEIELRDEPANPGFHGAGIAIRGQLNGVGFMLDVDDLHERAGEIGSLLSWYNEAPWKRGEPVRDFSDAFAGAVKDLGWILGRKHHKASSSGSWQQLLRRFAAGLEVAAAGQAFVKEEVEA
jgi:hypothetical protein